MGARGHRDSGAVGWIFRKLEVDRNIMTKRLANEIIVGLDIGTSKVLAVVAEVKENQDIEILGVGQHPSRGLRKGVVANIDSTVQSIQQAIEEAELTAECRISSVYAGIAGAHITSMNSSGVVAIKNRDEVSAEDVDRVLDAAQALLAQELDARLLGLALLACLHLRLLVREEAQLVLELSPLLGQQTLEQALVVDALLARVVLRLRPWPLPSPSS